MTVDVVVVFGFGNLTFGEVIKTSNGVCFMCKAGVQISSKITFTSSI